MVMTDEKLCYKVFLADVQIVAVPRRQEPCCVDRVLFLADFVGRTSVRRKYLHIPTKSALFLQVTRVFWK